MFVKEITSKRVRIDVPAKVNLFLEVLGLRGDGYHDIHSVFQAVSLFDSLEITLTQKPGVEISVSPPGQVSCGSDNLVAKSYHLFKKRFGLSQGISVNLTKRIPIAAGLGGGSADGAGTMLGLDRLCSLGLSVTELAEIGLEAGSDFPFFFSSLQAVVTGRGEMIEPVDLPTDYFLLLVTPQVEISTAKAYSRLKRDLTKPKYPFSLGRYPTSRTLLRGLSERGNDFEAALAADHPVLEEIRGWLKKRGARLVRMSGSGPTMFGWFDTDPGLGILELKSGENWQVNLVRPVYQPK